MSIITPTFPILSLLSVEIGHIASSLSRHVHHVSWIPMCSKGLPKVLDEIPQDPQREGGRISQTNGPSKTYPFKDRRVKMPDTPRKTNECPLKRDYFNRKY